MQDELIYGHVHLYPSDEQELRLKIRPEPKFYINKDNDRVGSWGYWAKDKYGQEVWFQGFPSKDDYPEEGGWRDKEEYQRQQMRWHDVWGSERKLLQYSGALRRQKKETRRRMEELF